MYITDFYAAWKHLLSADFQQNGVPAGSEPWVTKVTDIAAHDNIASAVLSDDNSMLAAGIGNEIHIYDMATSRLLHTLRGHAGYEVGTIVFQPGGRKLAAGLSRRLPRTLEFGVRVWDLDAAQPSNHTEEAARAAVSAASSILSQHWSTEDLESANLLAQITKVTAGTQAAVDTRNGSMFRGHLAGRRAFSSDGSSLLYIPGHTEVAVLDATTLTESFRLSGHTDSIMWAETSPNNKVVATVSWDQTVRIWSMEAGQTVHVLKGATNQGWAGAFSWDGELIAAGAGDQMVRIWRVDTGELLHTLGGFSGWVRSLAFSPDSLHLAAGGEGGTLRIFDVNSGESEQHWEINVEAENAESFLEVRSVQYTSGGDLFFTSSEGRIFGYRASHNLKWEFFDADSQDVMSGGAAIFARGSKLMAALGSNVCVWKTD